jgi:hypothetical protein
MSVLVDQFGQAKVYIVENPVDLKGNVNVLIAFEEA